ncbi:hypothetical protein EK21DRAFT_112911 [Setomelanomma holmii]|uniref:Uncharacterized protein n=1 Tax=Setomelanomma holmii TaxID=210430 RepID=A0A9P4LL78_9PLEO|nr:hypothetical protein EK21DRAFT_112911 [Setomelanomma holmii]
MSAMFNIRDFHNEVLDNISGQDDIMNAKIMIPQGHLVTLFQIAVYLAEDLIADHDCDSSKGINFGNLAGEPLVNNAFYSRIANQLAPVTTSSPLQLKEDVIQIIDDLMVKYCSEKWNVQLEKIDDRFEVSHGGEIVLVDAYKVMENWTVVVDNLVALFACARNERGQCILKEYLSSFAQR